MTMTENKIFFMCWKYDLRIMGKRLAGSTMTAIDISLDKGKFCGRSSQLG